MSEFAKKKRITEFAGLGCVLQGIGILAAIIGGGLGIVGGIIGGIALVVLFIVGSAKSQRWECGYCGHQLSAKSVTSCPACKSQFR